MPELIGKLQATFKSTLHPSLEWRKCLCMSCFGRVKSALDSSPLFTRSRLPPLFTHSSPGKSALFYRPNRSSFRFNSVRNPWSKNALLIQRNPMKKYPGEEWVKSGEEWCATLHLSDPQCLSGFQAIWWRVKSKKESGDFLSRRIVLCLAMARYCPGKGQYNAVVRQ